MLFMKEETLMHVFKWEKVNRNYEDVIYETYHGIAKITINRPEVRNAFRPKTVMELIDAFTVARDDAEIGVIILTGANHGQGVEKEAFCSGGDQKVRGNGGYVLHIVCDLTIASENAKFGQTGPKVGSFDAGYGAGYLARLVGHKKAREIWYLCRQYTAKEALEMGLVNTVVPFEQLEEETVKWAEEILQHSPMALRFLKASFNADTDGLAGLQQFAGDATLLYYTTDEAKEGRDAFKEKRKPDFKQFPKFP